MAMPDPLPPAGRTARPRLEALTSARFFAALAVMLFHFDAIAYPRWLVPVHLHGQAGVAFFFVLSGFILTYNYRDALAAPGRLAAWAFYRARLARIYPLHLATLLATTPLVLGLWVGGRPVVPADVGAVSAGALGLSWLAHLTLLQAWQPWAVYAAPWNTPAWSISVEAFCYLMSPWLFARCLPRLSSPARLAAFALAAWGAQAVGALACARFLPHLWIVVPLRFPEYVVGCALGAAFLDFRPATPARGGGTVLALALAAAYALCWLPGGADRLGWACTTLGAYVVFVPCWVAIIWTLAAHRTWAHALLEHRALVLLGEASFALYMIHAVGLLAFRAVGVPLDGPAQGVLMGVTIAASVAVHLGFERPMRTWLNGAKVAPPARSAA